MSIPPCQTVGRYPLGRLQPARELSSQLPPLDEAIAARSDLTDSHQAPISVSGCRSAPVATELHNAELVWVTESNRTPPCEVCIPNTPLPTPTLCASSSRYAQGLHWQARGFTPVLPLPPTLSSSARPESALVSHLLLYAPRAGFEPATFRLTVGRTAVVLTRIEFV